MIQFRALGMGTEVQPAVTEHRQRAPTFRGEFASAPPPETAAGPIPPERDPNRIPIRRRPAIPIGEAMTDQPNASTVILETYRLQYERARARVAEVAATPDAQPWEVEHARESLLNAQRCLDVHTVAFAMAGLS